MTASINKSRLMKRSWYLVKERSYSISYAMKTVWAEMKQALKDALLKIEIVAALEYTGSIWKPSAETMQSFYNSNCYKAD
jgi:hypothetical protein